jgi:hypothetical protein
MITYDKCDLNQPIFGPRTHLYSLEPIGLGSAFVESLTSYIARLAEAHAVSPGILVTKELWPRVSRTQGNGESGESVSPSYTFLYDAYVLNGMGRCTARWIPVLEALTGQRNLHLLTVLTWRRLLSSQGALLRDRQAWCPNCYADWRTSEHVVYEPLLWALRPVCVCPRHGVRLLEVCPHCRRDSPILTARSRRGHCSRCLQWLGSDQHRPVAKGDDSGYHLWVAEQVGALVVRAISFINPPQPQVFRQNVRACIDDLAEGNHSALARALCLHDGHFRNWMHHGLPQVQTLISVCFRLGIPPQRFLTERLGAGDPDWENARKIITHTGLRGPKPPTDAEVKRALRDALHSACPPALSELAVQLGFKRATALYRRDRSTCVRIAKVRIKLRAHTEVQSAAVSNAQAKNRLERALGEVPPPSADKVALELGLKHGSSLYTRFPVLCRTLAVVRRNYTKLRRLRVEATLKSALAEDPPPTLKQIANRLELRTPILLHQWFPNLCKLLAARRPEYHRERLARIRTRLQATLREDPAPMLQTIASRVGITRSYLATLFPDIWPRLGARSAEQRRRETKLRREALRQEVREITQKLLKTGTPPTRRRVASMITQSPIKFGPLLIPVIRKVEAEVRGQQVKL